MSLCVILQSYSRPCGGVTGGISDIWVFDPADLDFTQVTTPTIGAYTAVTKDVAVTGPAVFRINFQRKEANRTWTQSVTGCSVKYEHTVTAQLPQLSHSLTVFLQSLDAAGCCCGLGLIIRHNDGKIFVMGEKLVNGTAIPFFEVKVNGSTGDSGKLFDEFNGANVIFKGDYSRDLYEFTGGVAAIEALES